VHDLIFDFRGQSTAESIEPAKVRHGGHPARGGLTTVRAAVMVGSGAQPRSAGADLVRLSELPIYSTSVKTALLFSRPDQPMKRHMNIRHTPDTIAAPFGPYSHAIEYPKAHAPLHLRRGRCLARRHPRASRLRQKLAGENILAILADVGMGIGDLVKITTYLVRPEGVAAAGAARAKHFGDARPGSAKIIVKALVRPEWRIEIEAIAATKA
jgi:2-iminobutanoate/2-iminopropanoate deaminase